MADHPFSDEEDHELELEPTLLIVGSSIRRGIALRGKLWSEHESFRWGEVVVEL